MWHVTWFLQSCRTWKNQETVIIRPGKLLKMDTILKRRELIVKSVKKPEYKTDQAPCDLILNFITLPCFWLAGSLSSSQSALSAEWLKEACALSELGILGNGRDSCSALYKRLWRDTCGLYCGKNTVQHRTDWAEHNISIINIIITLNYNYTMSYIINYTIV